MGKNYIKGNVNMYVEKVERHLDYNGTLLKFEYKGTQKDSLLIKTARFNLRNHLQNIEMIPMYINFNKSE